MSRPAYPAPRSARFALVLTHLPLWTSADDVRSSSGLTGGAGKAAFGLWICNVVKPRLRIPGTADILTLGKIEDQFNCVIRGDVAEDRIVEFADRIERSHEHCGMGHFTRQQMDEGLFRVLLQLFAASLARYRSWHDDAATGSTDTARSGFQGPTVHR